MPATIIGPSIPQLLMPLVGSEDVHNMLKFACTLCSGALLGQMWLGLGMGRYSPHVFFWYCASCTSYEASGFAAVAAVPVHVDMAVPGGRYSITLDTQNILMTTSQIRTPAWTSKCFLGCMLMWHEAARGPDYRPKWAAA